MKEEREHCKYCEHELCPTCNECHNLEDNFYFAKPLKKCFDVLNNISVEHKHDLIDLNGQGAGLPKDDLPPAWACRVCKQIITEKCRFCGKLPCTEEKIGCLHD